MSELTIDVLELLKKPGVLDESQRRQLLDALQPRKMTYEEFLAWTDEDTYAEWKDGDVIMTSPANDKHQDVVRFLVAVLSIFVETYQLGIIRPAPFQMRLPQVPSGREPDVLFLAEANRERLKTTDLDGPADLVIEILSLDSAGRDRGEKFYEYQAAGIPEYWLADPQREQAEFYQLDDEGRYRMIFPDVEGVYHSKVLPGFWLKVAWLWQPPRVLDACRALGLI